MKKTKWNFDISDSQNDFYDAMIRLYKESDINELLQLMIETYRRLHPVGVFDVVGLTAFLKSEEVNHLLTDREGADQTMQRGLQFLLS